MKTVSYTAIENLMEYWRESALEYEEMAERRRESYDTIGYISALETAHTYDRCRDDLKKIKSQMEREGLDHDRE